MLHSNNLRIHHSLRRVWNLPVWSSAKFRSCRLYRFPAPFQKSMSDWKVILIAQGASQAQLAWPRMVYGTKTTASILPASCYSSTKGTGKFRNSPLTPVQTSFGLAGTLRSQRHRTSFLADRQRISALEPRFAAPSATFQILKRRPWLPEVQGWQTEEHSWSSRLPPEISAYRNSHPGWPFPGSIRIFLRLPSSRWPKIPGDLWLRSSSATLQTFRIRTLTSAKSKSRLTP